MITFFNIQIYKDDSLVAMLLEYLNENDAFVNLVTKFEYIYINNLIFIRDPDTKKKDGKIPL